MMKVLLVDDEDELRHAGLQTLMLADIACETYPRAQDALDRVSRGFPGVIVTDIRMPDFDGLWLMHEVLQIDPEFPVILVTGHGDVSTAVDAMRAGAFDFIEKPITPSQLVASVQRALQKRRVTLRKRAVARGNGKKATLESRLIGRSKAIQDLRQWVAQIAPTPADVLITGPTGSGKDIVARAVHDMSDRAGHAFVHINCAALPDAMVETELFGHEAGAFVGAMRARFGRFEHARQGTVFLDEIDSLSLRAQAKLLQAVQDRKITRLGANEPVSLDVRFIAAAKSDLQAAIAAGNFRADLFYRLSVVTLDLPPLSRRREDIDLLFHHLLALSAERHGRPVPEVPASILSNLASRPWPGNVRELGNEAERYLFALDTKVENSGFEAEARGGLAAAMANHERSLIEAVLRANGGRLKDSYEVLQISRKSLYEKMQKYGIDKTSTKDGGL